MNSNLTPANVYPLPRRMDFQFSDDIPKYFMKGNPVLSAWTAAMSTSFPEGERFFIQSVRNYQDQITDPELKKAVKGFIGQEAHHGREHDTLNEFLTKRGLPVAKEEIRLKKFIDFAQKYMPERRQLAITIALEHFTAIMADVYLADPELHDAGDPEVSALFYWHAIEETEHKAVAFDVYQQVEGSSIVRRLSMLQVTIGFMVQIFYMQTKYLITWGELFNLKAWGEALYFFWGKPGWFRKIIPSYLKYFKKDFHPWQEDNSHFLEGWEEHIAEYRNAAEPSAQ